MATAADMITGGGKLTALTAALERMNADLAAKRAAFYAALTPEAAAAGVEAAKMPTVEAAAVFLEDVARNARMAAGRPKTALEYFASEWHPETAAAGEAVETTAVRKGRRRKAA